MVTEIRHPDDALEGNDVTAAEGFAAVCPSGIPGLGSKPGFVTTGTAVGTCHRARFIRALSGFLY
ncbi:hypothetical protein D3C77_751320 [compost metagenome]